VLLPRGHRAGVCTCPRKPGANIDLNEQLHADARGNLDLDRDRDVDPQSHAHIDQHKFPDAQSQPDCDAVTDRIRAANADVHGLGDSHRYSDAHVNADSHRYGDSKRDTNSHLERDSD
jgi:hypothetical protein